MVELFEEARVAFELEADFAFGAAAAKLVAPGEGAVDGGVELVECEGFGDVFISADGQSLDHVLVGGARRDHDDWN